MLTIILYVLVIGFLACCAFGVVAITVKLCIDFVKFVKSEPGTALAFLVPLAVLIMSLIIGSYVMAGAMTLICGYTGLQMLVAFADFADDQMFPNRRTYSSGYSSNRYNKTITETLRDEQRRNTTDKWGAPAHFSTDFEYIEDDCGFRVAKVKEVHSDYAIDEDGNYYERS